MEMLRRSPPGGSSQQKGTPDTAVQVAMAPPSEEPCSGCGFCREDGMPLGQETRQVGGIDLDVGGSAVGHSLL